MMLFRTAVLALLATLLAACDETLPTAPGCSTRTVFAEEAFYRQRGEAEQVWSGIVRKACPPPSPGGRELCFTLDTAPLYAEGPAATAIFDALVGRQVTVRGKRVDVGYGAEIWPASVTSCG